MSGKEWSGDEWYTWGRTVDERGALDEAVRAYNEAVRLLPDHPSAWYFLFVAAYRQRPRNWNLVWLAYENLQRLKPALPYWDVIPAHHHVLRRVKGLAMRTGGRQLILAIGLALFLAVGLVPPWVRVDSYSLGASVITGVSPAGHSPIWQERPSVRQGREFRSWSVDLRRLAIYWLMIATATACAFALASLPPDVATVRDTRTSPSPTQRPPDVWAPETLKPPLKQASFSQRSNRRFLQTQKWVAALAVVALAPGAVVKLATDRIPAGALIEVGIDALFTVLSSMLIFGAPIAAAIAWLDGVRASRHGGRAQP